MPPKKAVVKPVAITWTWLIIAAGAALVLSLLASRMLLSKPDAIKEIRVDNTRIVIVDNFFPDALVSEWKSRMEREWEAGNWFFTTNNAGVFCSFFLFVCFQPFLQGTFDLSNLNQKVLSRRKVPERQEVALQLLEKNMFAYRKWELERNNSVHLDMLNYLETPQVRERVGKILRARVAEKLGDFFVTLYAKDDFLSAHSDVYGGTWAVVIYLADEGRPAQDGGELSFFCQSSGSWCQKVLPKRNRLVLFRTRRPGSKPLLRCCNHSKRCCCRWPNASRRARKEQLHAMGRNGMVQKPKTVFDIFEKSFEKRFDEEGETFSEFELSERNKMRNPVFER
jgi:hypothetical protein